MAEGPVLDQTTIENLKRLGGDEFLHELIDLFLEHSPILLEAIIKGESKADWDQVSRAAHSLKSSAGNIGALGLQTVASDLEQAAELSDVPTLTPLVDEVGPLFDNVVEELMKLK